jgi:opacity protein-like surface antigen
MKNQNEMINMKKIILCLLMSFLFFIATDAQAQECTEESYNCFRGNFYGKFLAGANFLQNTSIQGNKASYQTGYIIAGSLGYSLGCGIHLEGEYAYRRNVIKKIHFFGQGSSKHGHFQTSSYMANLLWDLPFRECAFWNIQPFIGAGIGYDSQRMHSSTSRIIFNQKWNHFSWQAMTGLAYTIFQNTKITLEYKFHQGGSHFNNHSLGVGLVYEFNFLK